MLAPTYGLESFTCPHCLAFAQQKWFRVMTNENIEHFGNQLEYELFGFVGNEKNGLAFCDCMACYKKTIWLDRKMVYPNQSNIENPKDLMPTEVRELYDEARAVFPVSPRASAALLRLALELLLPHLGATKAKPNAMIGQLVEDRKVFGRVQEAMDYLRVTGNDAVHPGLLDHEGKDDAEVSRGLFKILNYIVAETIESDAMVRDLYQILPERVREGIENRDRIKK